MPLLALTDLSMTSFQIAEEFFLQCIETNSNKVFKKLTRSPIILRYDQNNFVWKYIEYLLYGRGLKNGKILSEAKIFLMPKINENLLR